MNKLVAILAMTYGKKPRSFSKEANYDESQGKTQIENISIERYNNDKTLIGRAEDNCIKTYKGFTDVNYITVKGHKELFEEVLFSLTKQKIKIYKKKMYAMSCQKQDVKFELEIMALEEPRGFNYIRLKKIEGTMEKYKEVVSNLMSAINL